MQLLNTEILAIAIYVCILITIGLLSYRKHRTATEFILGGRSMNFWLTAFAAHASDMSSWLFMGYPAVIFSFGIFNAWLAIGLIIFMFLNWHFIAPKIRIATEQYQSLTFSTFFESRLADTSGLIRLFTGIMAFFFFSVYISAGLVSLGLLIESLFGINYFLGITVGIVIIIPYLFIGGYITLAWMDLFQALFLLFVIALVPIVALSKVGGVEGTLHALTGKTPYVSLIPEYSLKGGLEILFLLCGWGLGYFGQPHIVTKFMGIKKVEEMRKSKYVGMSWMILTLALATIIGLIGIPFFKDGLGNSELVFVTMVHDLFPGFIAAFILCAIFAATISTMDSQILVLSSVLAEDFYKRVIKKNASSDEILRVSRYGIFVVAFITYIIAFIKPGTIFSLVAYAWFGLGSSFGPLLIMTLYSKKVNKYGAWAGIVLGGVISAVWPLINRFISLKIPPLIPGFLLSLFAIWLTSQLTSKKIYV